MQKIKGEGPKKKLYYEGEIIFSEGGVAHDAFIIDSGSVEITKAAEARKISLAVLTQGELFGEMAMIDNAPRMASAHALEDTVLMRVSRDYFDERLDAADMFLKALFRILVGNLRSVHQSYMRRPRSFDDYLAAIDSHLGGVRGYMDKPEAEAISGEVTLRVKKIRELVAEMKDISAGHEDRRKSVLSEEDLDPQGKPEAKELS
ncbi:MAG: cyclic nucleotide-binding domain-containing protein [Alphaproteobacteria bacterium]|nr:cyclic nucleotide-binding domain-containing protein [Alphaproteobacteria bacterium]